MEFREFRDTPHVPDDAKEYEEDFIDILNRIPIGWGRWISCDSGWYKLIIEAHNMLKYIDPNYEIHQIKEKFGGLRYYYQSSFPYGSLPQTIMDAIINHAEGVAESTCEVCGIYDCFEVKNRDRNRWYKTLCKKCAILEGYSIKDDDK